MSKLLLLVLRVHLFHKPHIGNLGRWKDPLENDEPFIDLLVNYMIVLLERKQ